MQTQDPWFTSFRVASAAMAVLSAIVIDPNVQAELIRLIGVSVPVQYAPMATALVSAILAIVSKSRDQRPVRTS